MKNKKYYGDNKQMQQIKKEKQEIIQELFQEALEKIAKAYALCDNKYAFQENEMHVFIKNVMEQTDLSLHKVNDWINYNDYWRESSYNC